MKSVHSGNVKIDIDLEDNGLVSDLENLVSEVAVCGVVLIAAYMGFDTLRHILKSPFK